MRDHPREYEMQRRATALAEHGVEHAAERLPADEERQHLVLVRRVGRELHEQECDDTDGATRDACLEPSPTEGGDYRDAPARRLTFESGGLGCYPPHRRSLVCGRSGRWAHC